VATVGRDGKERSGWSVDRALTLQHHFEGSIVGEAAISGLVAVIFLIGVVWNLPESEIERRLVPILRPLAAATGLNYGWSMYAPNPPEILHNVEVRVTMADGDVRIWTVQPGERVIGQFAWGHWEKLMWDAADSESEIREGIAHWVVRELTEPSERAIRVEMIDRIESLPPPGEEGPGTTTVETLYDEDLTGQQ
jgi:hypothetical protein